MNREDKVFIALSVVFIAAAGILGTVLWLYAF